MLFSSRYVAAESCHKMVMEKCHIPTTINISFFTQENDNIKNFDHVHIYHVIR